jgi:hypothetical protein
MFPAQSQCFDQSDQIGREEVMPMPAELMIEEIRFSEAKVHLSRIMSDVVRREQVVAIRRGHAGDEVMFLLPPELLSATLGDIRFSVDYLPDEEGIGIWLNDLEIGAHGADVDEARRNLIREVRAWVANYLGELRTYIHWPDRFRLWPQVLRLAITRNDGELADLLFAPVR